MPVAITQLALVVEADGVMADIHSYYTDFVDYLQRGDHDGAQTMLLNLCASCDDLQDIANRCSSEEPC